MSGAFQERVKTYAVVHLKNDIVDFHAVVRLTTETGHQAFIGFSSRPPADWLQFVDSGSNVFLSIAEFDRIHRTLQSEQPVFYTALSFIGLRAFNLGTGTEAPGEGPADGSALAEFAAQVREHLKAAQAAAA